MYKSESTVIYLYRAFAQFFYILGRHWRSQYRHGEGRLFKRIEDVSEILPFGIRFRAHGVPHSCDRKGLGEYLPSTYFYPSAEVCLCTRSIVIKLGVCTPTCAMDEKSRNIHHTTGPRRAACAHSSQICYGSLHQRVPAYRSPMQKRLSCPEGQEGTCETSKIPLES
jgi:hypothetical protein